MSIIFLVGVAKLVDISVGWIVELLLYTIGGNLLGPGEDWGKSTKLKTGPSRRVVMLTELPLKPLQEPKLSDPNTTTTTATCLLEKVNLGEDGVQAAKSTQ